MKKLLTTALLVSLSLFALSLLGGVKYTSAKPLSKVITTKVASCGSSASMKVPMIAWGGDIATVYANGNSKTTAPGSIFAKEGLDITLFRQDDFKKQVEGYLKCETPFLRGTMGMLNMAAEVTDRNPKTKMVFIYQLTWSTGGDGLVAKKSVKKPKDLRGKTVALQAYGPHVDYMTTVLKSAGLSPKDVKIKWLTDLMEVNSSSEYPAKAFRQDKTVDAAFVIIPDAASLTSGLTVGTGAEGSVRGAKMLLSTKTATAVIADVYAVRADYFKANRDKVMKFVRGLMAGEEKTKEVFASRTSRKAEFKKTVKASAKLLLDSAQATEDMEAMYTDCTAAGFKGNVKFFQDANYPRNFKNITAEDQNAFLSMGLLSKKVKLTHANWDYSKFSKGLQNTKGAETTRFDKAAVSKMVDKKIKQNRMGEGELFGFEIYFQPEQNSFSVDVYKNDFDKLINLASTYGGAVITVEGHSDPLGYLQSKKDGKPSIILNRKKQAAKNLSYSRANAVVQSIIAYAKSKGVVLDETQFAIVGHGVMKPATPGCSYDSAGDIDFSCAPQSQDQWAKNRRVKFGIMQVETEATVFKPLQ